MMTDSSVTASINTIRFKSYLRHWQQCTAIQPLEEIDLKTDGHAAQTRRSGRSFCEITLKG